MKHDIKHTPLTLLASSMWHRQYYSCSDMRPKERWIVLYTDPIYKKTYDCVCFLFLFWWFQHVSFFFWCSILEIVGWSRLTHIVQWGWNHHFSDLGHIDVRLVKLQMLRLAEELDSAPGIQKFDSCSIAVVLGIAHSETESMPVHQVPIWSPWAHRCNGLMQENEPRILEKLCIKKG
jgi:hypothetical protein